MNDADERDPRLFAIPDTHGHAKGEHKPYVEERPLPLTARMLFLWFYHACRRGYPRFLMVADHMNYLTFEDPAAVNLVRRALKLAQAGDLYGAAETASVDVGHAAVVSEGLRRGMRYSIGAEVDNDPRSRPDAQNIVDAMRPDAIIRSIHFIPITHPVHGENWPWPFDNPEFKDLFEVVGTEQTWELYVNALVDAIERLPGHIVGHFFVPAVFGNWPDDAKLDAYENRVLDAAAARGMAVEFNSRFFYRDHSNEEKDRYLEANSRFLRKAKERGVAIAIGSDAHSPKDQGGAFEVVLHVLDSLDINEIVFPLGGQLRRVALRVVREPEPEPVPEPAPQPEPQKAAGGDHAVPGDGAAAAAEAAKPVRKARPTAKATRPPQTSPERPPERPESPVATTDPPPPAHAPEPAPDTAAASSAEEPAARDASSGKSSENGATGARPARPRRGGSRPAKTPESPAPEPNAEPSVAAPAPAAEVPPAPAPVPKPAAKPVAPKVTAAKTAPRPSAKPAPAKAAMTAKPAPARAGAAKPAASRPAAAKSSAAKPAPARAKAPAAKPAAAKATPAKSGAKKTAASKPAPKKAPPARAAAKKAPAKKTAPAKKSPAKKAAPARAAAKKPVPVKKAAAKKKAPARSAPARKVTAAKKAPAKKTATKRR